MNRRTLAFGLLIATGLAFGIDIATPSPLRAATYDFNVNIDSGPLSANQYTGSFSYENSTLQLTLFDFFFEGLYYSLNDDPLASVSQSGADFLGLIYSVDGSPSNPLFSFVPGTSVLSDAYFAYDLNSNLGAGFGSIIYNKLNTPDTNPVPAPLPVMGVAAFFAYSRKLRKRNQLSSAFLDANSSRVNPPIFAGKSQK